MPAIQSSEGDDTTASREESDTLICGFGLRRTQGDSNSLDSSDNFGIGGLNNADTELNSSLICGFGDNSYGSRSSRGDIIVGVIEESISTMHHKVTDINKEVTENEIDSDKVKSSKVNVSAQNNGDHFFQIPIPTKTVCNSSMSVPRMDSKSVSSEGESMVSMASEDAVVLMVNMLEEDISENKEFQDEVCGRIFKRQQTSDYESIPIELEIENGVLDQSWSSLPNNHISDRSGFGHEDVETKKLVPEGDIFLHSRGHRTSLKNTGQPQQQKQLSSKQVGPAPHIKSSNSTTYMSEKGGNNVKGRNSCGKSTVSFQSLGNTFSGFPSSVDQVQQRRRPSGAENLDVIKEDDNDSSTVATDLKNSFLSQGTALSKVSDSSSGDTSFSSSSRLNPIGEHAKSMARQFKMDAIVDTPLRGPSQRIREYA